MIKFMFSQNAKIFDEIFHTICFYVKEKLEDFVKLL